MSQPPFSTADDHSSRVYLFDGDLTNTIYQLGVDDAFITGSIRYVLAVRDFFFDSIHNNQGGGGGGGTPTPIMTLSADSLRFDDTEVGGTSPEETLFITNTGTANLIITGFISQPPFTFVSPVLPIGLVPGQTTSFVGKFKPTSEGEKTLLLPIISNAPTSPRLVSLSGLALPEVIIPADPLWNYVGGFLEDITSNTDMVLPLPPGLENNDLLFIAVTWRGSRYDPPDGWEVVFEANTSMGGRGTRVSTMVLYKVKFGPVTTPILSPRIPGPGYMVATLACFRPKNGVPVFDGLTDKESSSGEFTFEAPSLQVPKPNSLLIAIASCTDAQGANLNPFGAVGLSAAFSDGIEFISDGSQWGQYSYNSILGLDSVGLLMYGLTPTPSGPTGKFVGTAAQRGQHRCVVCTFSGPTGT